MKRKQGISKSYNFYFAFTQLMFWSIYEDSKPFREVNYRPEVFYRSLDKLFLRTSFVTSYRRQLLGSIIKLQKIFNEDSTNKDISNHLGFSELTAFYSGLVSIDGKNVGIRLRTFAGSKLL